jgi:hypothetical protein
MKHTCLRTLILLACIGGATAPARADDEVALTTQIQTLDANAATRSPGAVSGKISSDFQSFAGSRTNSVSLVEGLRAGSSITLTAPHQQPATFTPSTRPMGWGNVSTSLALAQYQLGQQGITSPTPLQMQTALNGGTITANGQTVYYEGVLQMRASGMGWGEIAQASGTKLGPVISSVKTHSVAVSALPTARPVSGVAPVTGQGVVTANGAVASGRADAPGQTKTASGAAQGKGIVNAGGGASNGVVKGNAATPTGQGVVTAAGASAVAGGTGTAAGKGITSAGGTNGNNGGGNGKALGLAK